MTTTPLTMIDSVVRSVFGDGVVATVVLAGGGMNETYRAELGSGRVVVVRFAHRDAPWFGDEAHLMAQARAAGVPTPEVFGLEHHEHDGELLSFSVQEFIPDTRWTTSFRCCRTMTSTSCSWARARRWPSCTAWSPTGSMASRTRWVIP